MIFGDRDLFESWRMLLTIACSVYATVITVRSLWGWVQYFSGKDPITSLMRSYVLNLLVRVRLRRFRQELLGIGVWLVVLILLLYVHAIPSQL